ncbi:hypothetical protein DFH08DRAFT_808769 [Mycena albidolilacea]|uniref:Uncharacterized protein n=1 Tax=Mycena albidolilacea TaxID=1033008 RepID=A0AAD7ER56_9AGAR|nr:hypothetical protein DFH08DRAFT_808769 [Mycena albidolilacea]
MQTAKAEPIHDGRGWMVQRNVVRLKQQPYSLNEILQLGAGVKRYMQHEDGIKFEATSITYQLPNNECPKTHGYTGRDDKMDKELVPGTAMTIMVSATSAVLRQISKLKRAQTRDVWIDVVDEGDNHDDHDVNAQSANGREHTHLFIRETNNLKRG